MSSADQSHEKPPPVLQEETGTRPPKPAKAYGTCDWGDCDEPAVDHRWADEPEHRAWLEVCAAHREETGTRELVIEHADCDACGGSGWVQRYDGELAHAGNPDGDSDAECPECGQTGIGGGAQILQVLAARIELRLAMEQIDMLVDPDRREDVGRSRPVSELLGEIEEIAKAALVATKPLTAQEYAASLPTGGGRGEMVDAERCRKCGALLEAGGCEHDFDEHYETVRVLRWERTARMWHASYLSALARIRELEAARAAVASPTGMRVEGEVVCDGCARRMSGCVIEERTEAYLCAACVSECAPASSTGDGERAFSDAIADIEKAAYLPSASVARLRAEVLRLGARLPHDDEEIERVARSLNDEWAANPSHGAFWADLEESEREHWRNVARAHTWLPAASSSSVEGGSDEWRMKCPPPGSGWVPLSEEEAHHYASFADARFPEHVEGRRVGPWRRLTTADAMDPPPPSVETGPRTSASPSGETAREQQLVEFDAWLSMRGEFGEVLTAFRQAFGTDTSAAAPPAGETGDGRERYLALLDRAAALVAESARLGGELGIAQGPAAEAQVALSRQGFVASRVREIPSEGTGES